MSDRRIHPDDVTAIAREVCRAGGDRPDASFHSNPCRRYARGATYFARWSVESSNVSLVPLTPTFSGERQMVATPDEDPRWWVVSAWGRSIVESTSSTMSPARESELSSADVRSLARLRIRWNNPGGGAVRTVTIGTGVQVAVYACGVTALVQAPPEVTWGPRSSTGITPVPTFPTGTVVTESVGVEIHEGLSPLGFSRPQLVDTVLTAGGTGARITVPPGARVVTLSQPAGSLNAANFIFDVTGALIEPVVMDATARTVRVRVPSHASHLEITGANNNVLTAIWEIDV